MVIMMVLIMVIASVDDNSDNNAVDNRLMIVRCFLLLYSGKKRKMYVILKLVNIIRL